jgi:hypothetical protein
MNLQQTVRRRRTRLYRGINEFKRSHQPKSNLVKDENGDLPADSQNILNMWKNYYSQLLNVRVHRASDVRQVEIHTADPLAPDPSLFQVEFAVGNLERYKPPDSLILCGLRKNCLISGRSLLLYQFRRRTIKVTVVIVMGYHCYQLHTSFYPISFIQCYVHI